MVKKKRSDREKKNQCNISMLQHNTKNSKATDYYTWHCNKLP